MTAGIIAKKIITSCTDYNIIGVMDRDLKSGVFEGKPILDYETVIASGADIVITATKDDHVNAVFNRISHFCSYNGISLYDYKGNNLFCDIYDDGVRD